MADETQVVQATQTLDPFSENSWAEQPNNLVQEEAEKKEEQKNEEAQPAEFNANDYLKNKFGWENEDVALKTLLIENDWIFDKGFNVAEFICYEIV